MPDLTRTDVLAAKARAEAAPEGPWEWGIGSDSIFSAPTTGALVLVLDDDGPLNPMVATRNFIAAARADVLALADQALRQMDEIEKLRMCVAGARDTADHFGCALLEISEGKHADPVAFAHAVVRIPGRRWEPYSGALRADLAAARAATERVEALADSLDDEARKFGRASYIEEADRTRFVARQLRAALRGEGAKDA